MHDAGLKMLHDMYLDTKNTTGFWEALQVYRDSSAYRLVASPLPLSPDHGLQALYLLVTPICTLSARPKP